MLLLLRPSVPRPRYAIRPERLQTIPLLPPKMPQAFQSKTQSPQTRLDKGRPQAKQQIDLERHNLLAVTQSKRTLDLQPKRVHKYNPSNEKNSRYPQKAIG